MLGDKTVAGWSETLWYSRLSSPVERMYSRDSTVPLSMWVSSFFSAYYLFSLPFFAIFFFFQKVVIVSGDSGSLKNFLKGKNSELPNGNRAHDLPGADFWVFRLRTLLHLFHKALVRHAVSEPTRFIKCKKHVHAVCHISDTWLRHQKCACSMPHFRHMIKCHQNGFYQMFSPKGWEDLGTRLNQT